MQCGLAAADARLQEQVPAVPLQRGPQHGLRDAQARAHPLLPVQEVPGVSDEDSQPLQPLLCALHQAKRVQEADGRIFLLSNYRYF